MALLAQKKVRTCWGCLSANCLTKQHISVKNKLKKRYVASCTGKRLTFEELKDQIKQASTTESSTASTTIRSPTVTNYDSDASLIGDDMANFNSFQSDKNEEFGFKENVADFSTKIPISKDTIPVYAQLKKTSKIADKHCTICLKSNMTLKCLSTHLDNFHDIIFYYGDESCSTIDHWLEADENWQLRMKIDPPKPHPCDYETEKREEDSESNSQSEEEKEETTIPRFTLPPSRNSHLDSSSDSSDENPQSKFPMKIPRVNFVKRLTTK